MNRLLPVALLLVAAATAYLLLASDPAPQGSAGDAAAAAAGAGPEAGSLAGSGSDPDAAPEAAPAIERDASGIDSASSDGTSTGTARVRARFVDTQGRAIRDLRVSAEARNGFGDFGFAFEIGGPAEAPAGEGTQPDATGSVVLEVATGEALTVVGRGDYWAAVEIPLQPLRNGEVLDVGTRTLAPAARVHGEVTAADGSPLAGATVELRSERGFGFGDPFGALQATTDADGRYALGGVRTGDYALTVRGPGHAEHSVPGFVVPAGGGDLREDFRMRPGLVAHGMVVDQDRNPVAGAELRVQGQGFGAFRLVSDGGRSATPPGAVSGSDGRFALSGLPERDGARVLATADGFAPTSEPFVGEDGELVLELQRQVRFDGTLLDADGRPAVGVKVEMRPQDRSDWRFWLRERNATTDAEGHFAFADIEPGLYRIEASTPVAALTGVEMQLDVDQTEVELRMRSVPVLVVEVRDPQGLPLGDARVSLEPKRAIANANGVRGMRITASSGGLASAELGGGRTLRTDAEGRAWFPELAEGSYEMTVRAEGMASETRDLARARGPQREEVRLLPGADLRVQAVNAEGLPVEGVNVVLQDYAGGPERTRRSDVAGRAWWDGLAPGRYAVRAAAGEDSGVMRFVQIDLDGPDDAAQTPRGEPIELAAGEHADLILTIDELAMPELLVTRDGEPVAGATARLERVQQEEDSGFGGLRGFSPFGGGGRSTGPDGRLRLDPVEPGDYELWVRPTPGSPESKQLVSLQPGPGELEFQVQGSRVEGRILGMQGPLGGARVSLERHREQAASSNQVMVFSLAVSGPGGDVISMSSGPPTASVRTDADGRFEFLDVPAGDWVVVARARDYMEWRSEPFPVSGSGRVDAGVGRLETGGRIEGRVPQAEGGEAFGPDNMIRLMTEDGKQKEITLARDGRYAFDDLPPGRYVVAYRGSESGVLEVEAGRTVRHDLR